VHVDLNRHQQQIAEAQDRNTFHGTRVPVSD
jgi:hypothetical protein